MKPPNPASAKAGAAQQEIVDDYLREVRALFDAPRTFQRTVYRPSEICQFDLWEPRAEVPVGHGQTRRGWVVVACLGYSRAGAGALVFSTRIPELLFAIRRCLWSLGALPQTLVWDRQAGLHAGGGRPTEAFAAFCGVLRVGWHFCEPRDPQAKGCVERRGAVAPRQPPPATALLRVVQLSSERARQVVRQDCSFAKKQESRPVLLVVVSLTASASV